MMTRENLITVDSLVQAPGGTDSILYHVLSHHAYSQPSVKTGIGHLKM